MPLQGDFSEQTRGTLDMRQSKTLILSTNVDKNHLWQSFRLQFVARLWQSKTLFLVIFDRRSCADPGGSNFDNFFFKLMRGEERIQIPQKAGHHRPTSETPHGVSLAGRWWPNIECWLCTFVALCFFRGSGPVFLWKPFIL